ncbi:MAG TPA: glycosyltransferase, partial [Gaiellaceae bacterium]|nr:glycosyltransferase [Gaiellaceae bacterium]
ARAPRDLLAAARGAALARALDPARDHVHAQFPLEAASAGLFAARFSGARYSFSVHTLHRPPLVEAKLRAAAFVVAGSEYERDEVGCRYGEAARAKVEVRRLGVPPREQRDGFEPGLVVSVGTLAGKKGHDVLIRAVAATGLEPRLVIVGEGPERPALEALARELGVRAELPGTMPHADALALTARAQAFALCCRETADGDHDFLPVALMDAMSLGVPCLSTRFVGIPELIEDGVSGLLAAPGDAASAAERLSMLLGDEALGARLGAAGRERVRADFDLDRNTAKLAELFRARLS